MNNQFYLPKISLFFLFLFAAAGWIFCADDHPEDQGASGIHHEFSHNQLKRGERLFYGLIPLGENAKACANCHNIRALDTLSWNPSAYDLAITDILIKRIPRGSTSG